MIVRFLDGIGCPNDHFICRNKRCLLPSFKCDGKDDCGDNSDENDGCIGICMSLKYSKYSVNSNITQYYIVE